MKKWVVVAILALLAGDVAAQQQTAPGEQELRAGDAAFKKKDWDTAITSFEAALSKNPDFFVSHYFLGWAYQNKREFTKSAENFVKYLSKAQDNPKAADMVTAATRQAGIGFSMAKQYDAAMPYLNKAATAKPNDVEVQYYLGVAQMQMGDDATSEQTFVKVIQLQPNLDRAYYFAGRFAHIREDWALAKERLGKYVELKPDGEFAAESYFMLGSMAVRDGQLQTAKAHLTKALQLEPRSANAAEAYYILGNLAARAEDFDTASSYYEKFLQLRPTGPQAEEIRKFLADLK